MKISVSVFAIFAIFFLTMSSAFARPQYKDLDYRLFEDDDSGVVIDKVYEPITPKHKHHHHHHKKYLKNNRLERLKRFLNNL